MSALIKNIMDEKKVSLNIARDIVTAKTVFTTHTPVPAGNDIFPLNLIEKYFKENLAEIQINMGLAEVEEFINLVNILKSYKISERAYTGGKLVENSIKDYDTYMSFLLEMYYGEVTITFDVTVVPPALLPP